MKELAVNIIMILLVLGFVKAIELLSMMCVACRNLIQDIKRENIRKKW